MKMKKDLQYLYLTLISLAVIIILYYIILKKIYKDKLVDNEPLNKKIITMPLLGKNCCSWWPVSHYISFFIFSYIWPQYWHHLFMLGVAWECVEWLLKYMMTPLGQELKFKRTRLENGSVEYEQWWSSSNKDIIFNSAGIMSGLLLNKLINE